MLEKNIENVESELEKTLFKTSLKEKLTNAPIKTAAQTKVSLAYTMATLYYILLRAHGEDTKTHGINLELERIKKSFVEVSKFSKKRQAKPVDSTVVSTTDLLRERSKEMASAGSGSRGDKDNNGKKAKLALKAGAGSAGKSSQKSKTIVSQKAKKGKKKKS